MDLKTNIVSANLDRQVHDRLRLKYEKKFHLTENLIKRLGLIHELEGHTGCVNCLDWHESGEVLISGSDDCRIILWNPYKRKAINVIRSGHTGNIFSVKYLKTSSGNCIVTGAADHRIRVHDISDSECLFDCNCHSNRVKRLATHTNEPFVFLSAAEDGLILQFDLREKHQCSQTCVNVLIDLNSSIGISSEAKCLAINPMQPELLAVGSSDPYIRLYDRRMISLTQAKHPPSISFSLTMSSLARPVAHHHESDDSSWIPPPSNIPMDSVRYYVPGHLQPKRKPKAIACTYLSFNSRGNELLANLGGEQIYLFDINKLQPLHSFYLPTSAEANPKPSSSKTCSTAFKENGSNNDKEDDEDKPNGTKEASSSSQCKKFSKSRAHDKYLDVYGVRELLPPKVQTIKEQANEFFDNGDYISAVSLYNSAIRWCPNAAVLYGNRAIALMKRVWDGDVYSALRDCCQALELDKTYFRAHFRMARCLFELKRYKDAYDCFERFKTTFPAHVKDQSCVELERQIIDYIETMKEKEFSTSAKEDSSSASGIDPSAGVSSSPSSSSSSRNLSFKPKKFLLTEQEIIWRSKASDYKQRFCGHCNTTTDIKEAIFFGRDDQYVIAGSDDGNLFIWDAKTTNIVRVLKGDETIVNCLQPHPYDCLLATSGLDTVVRLWSPRPEEGPEAKESNEVKDINSVTSANHKLMYENPIELAMLNMGYRIRADSDSSDHSEDILQCRAS